MGWGTKAATSAATPFQEKTAISGGNVAATVLWWPAGDHGRIIGELKQAKTAGSGTTISAFGVLNSMSSAVSAEFRRAAIKSRKFALSTRDHPLDGSMQTPLSPSTFVPFSRPLLAIPQERPTG